MKEIEKTEIELKNYTYDNDTMCWHHEFTVKLLGVDRANTTRFGRTYVTLNIFFIILYTKNVTWSSFIWASDMFLNILNITSNIPSKISVNCLTSCMLRYVNLCLPMNMKRKKKKAKLEGHENWIETGYIYIDCMGSGTKWTSQRFNIVLVRIRYTIHYTDSS